MARICRGPARARRCIRYRRPLQRRPTTGGARGCNLKVHLFLDNVRKCRRHRHAYFIRKILELKIVYELVARNTSWAHTKNLKKENMKKKKSETRVNKKTSRKILYQTKFFLKKPSKTICNLLSISINFCYTLYTFSIYIIFIFPFNIYIYISFISMFISANIKYQTCSHTRMYLHVCYFIFFSRYAQIDSFVCVYFFNEKCQNSWYQIKCTFLWAEFCNSTNWSPVKIHLEKTRILTSALSTI